jgi:hypothetical protein
MYTTATRRVRSRIRRRWRLAVAWAALLALAWPSLGPLPYLVHPFDATASVRAGDPHGAAEHHDHHIDLAAIPGSPTHPPDHGCAECEVLKHLSRCMLRVVRVAVAPPVLVAIVKARIVASRPVVTPVAHPPPARAPPLLEAPSLSVD